jgi:hypothetical protein
VNASRGSPLKDDITKKNWAARQVNPRKLESERRGRIKLGGDDPNVKLRAKPKHLSEDATTSGAIAGSKHVGDEEPAARRHGTVLQSSIGANA